MPKVVRRVVLASLSVVGAAILAVGSYLLYVAASGIPHYAPEKVELSIVPTPERVARGHQLASMLCADCHLDEKTGTFSGKLMTDAPKEFGVVYSRNITRHPSKGIGAWTDGEIAVALRTGVARDGRYMPPWMSKQPHMSDEDMASMIAFLRSDDPWVRATDVDSRPVVPSFVSKLLSHLVFAPLPYPREAVPMPDAGDELALGRYYAHVLECYACHSADFKKLDSLHPERSAGYFGGGNAMFDSAGATVVTANLTPDDETGIGRWSREEFVRALKKGFAPGGRPLQFPMEVYPALTDAEAGALYAYLRTVPTIHHAIPRAAPAVAGGGASPGAQVYAKYRCRGCHGEAGAGSCDLRGAATKYPTDDRLIAFIKKPVAVVPDSKMPSWDGVIQDGEYSALCEYVRVLAGARPGGP